MARPTPCQDDPDIDTYPQGGGYSACSVIITEAKCTRMQYYELDYTTCVVVE